MFLLSAMTNTMLIFSHISNTKKRKAQPVIEVSSASSDVYVIHTQDVLLCFMFICISLVRLSRLQSHLPKNAPGPLLLCQEHWNLMRIIYVRTAQINKASPRFLFFSSCFLCFSILGQCLKGVLSMLSLFLYSRSLLFYFLEGKL